jgi:hypothetical protein
MDEAMKRRFPEALRRGCVGMVFSGLSLLAGCGSSAQPGAELVGTWGGMYTWDFGQSYAVTLVVPRDSITSKSGTQVHFHGIERAGECDRVEVEGTFDTKSRQVTLDEVATECPAFILDGVYDGHLSTGSPTMNLVWGSGDETDEITQGSLELTRLSAEPPKPA